MAENKTQPTDESVDEFLQNVEPERRRIEGLQLNEIFKKATGDIPVLWGPSIIGYGTYHYKYESGREGDFLRVGYSPRKSKHSLYIMGPKERYQKYLDNLGKYKTGKSCIYVNKLSDINIEVLSEMIADAYQYIGEKKWP